MRARAATVAVVIAFLFLCPGGARSQTANSRGLRDSPQEIRETVVRYRMRAPRRPSETVFCLSIKSSDPSDAFMERFVQRPLPAGVVLQKLSACSLGATELESGPVEWLEEDAVEAELSWSTKYPDIQCWRYKVERIAGEWKVTGETFGWSPEAQERGLAVPCGSYR